MITHQGIDYTINNRVCMALDQVDFMHPRRSAGTLFVGSKDLSGKGLTGRCRFSRDVAKSQDLSDGTRVAEYVSLNRFTGSRRRGTEAPDVRAVRRRLRLQRPSRRR
ncbi:hypothetical protein ACRAWG_32610 [Methylobacterium sp. P31]